MFSAGHEAVKPAFTAEPDDSYVLPNSLAPLLCKAKFVSQLKFNCSGGLVPKEAYHGQNEHNVTTLIADVSQAMVKTTALDWVSCVCIAAGHNGVVLRSKTAVVMLACKYFKQCLWLSEKNSSKWYDVAKKMVKIQSIFISYIYMQGCHKGLKYVYLRPYYLTPISRVQINMRNKYK